MKSWAVCIIAFSFLWMGPFWAQAQEELPFWRTKPKLLKKILQQRKVVVSVKTDSGDHVPAKVRVVGVGAVNVPIGFAKEQVMLFEELPKVSGYFKKVVHRPKKREVYFFIKALGYQMRFVQEYKWSVQKDGQAQLDWRVTSGQLTGMVGHYRFRKVNERQTEIALWSNLDKKSLPLPAFLLGFTLEVIAEKTAQKMRTFIEDKYRKSQAARKTHVEK